MEKLSFIFYLTYNSDNVKMTKILRTTTVRYKLDVQTTSAIAVQGEKTNTRYTVSKFI